MLALIVLPILTSYLTTEEYGTYDLVISFAGLLIPLLTIQIQQAVFRYLLSAVDIEDKKAYVTVSVAYVVVSSAVLLPIVFLVLKLLGVEASYAVLICVLYLAETIYTLFGQIVRGLGHNAKYSISVIVYSTVKMLLMVLLIAKLRMGLYGVLISITAAYICSDIYMILSTRLYKYISLSYFIKRKLKELTTFSLPIVPSSIALWIVNLSDRMVIIHYLGSAANGIYAVSNKIPTLYNTAYNVFNLAWTETAARTSDDGDPSEYYSNLFDTLFKFLIGAMLAIIAVTPLLFTLLVKGDFKFAISQVPILYFGVFFNSLVNYYSGIYIALKRTKQVGISSAVGAILNLGINLMFVKSIGLYAASISTALSFMIIAVYRAYDLNKVITIKYDKKRIIIGLALFALPSGLLSVGNSICVVGCFALAIVYNFVVNRKVFSSMIKKFLRR